MICNLHRIMSYTPCKIGIISLLRLELNISEKRLELERISEFGGLVPSSNLVLDKASITRIRRRGWSSGSARLCLRLLALPVSTDLVWHAHAKRTQFKFTKIGWGKYDVRACVFSVFRAFNILNGYVKSVQMEQARNSDSTTPKKKYNRTSGTDLS